MSPSSASYGGSGGTGSFDVTAGDVCTWSVQTSASWITVTSGASGKGNGHVGYTVLANNVTSPRSAAVTIGSTDFSVSQAPMSVNCSFAVSPTFSSFPGDGGSGDVSVGGPSGCPWSATPTVNWITVTNGATGSGNGNVSFTVAPNGGSATREGAITVAGQTVGVAEAAPAPNCTFAASPQSASYDATGGTGTVAVAAASNCAWSATAGATWITVTGGAVGTGNGTVQYSVAANTTGAARTAALTVAGITVTITQAAPCAFTVKPASATYAAPGGTGTITVTTTAGCAWTAAENAAWITITAGASGTGSGTVSYSVAVNATGKDRTTTITVAGVDVAITETATLHTAAADATARGTGGDPAVMSVGGRSSSGRSLPASGNEAVAPTRSIPRLASSSRTMDAHG